MLTALWGTIINALAIIAAGVLGIFLPKMPETMHRTVIQAIGIFTCVLGVGMALKGEETLYLVISLAGGTLLGEAIGVERGFERVGAWLERKVGGEGSGKVGQAFVTSTLIFCIGAMAILGPIESATGQGHSLLYTKSIMDGMITLILASTLGIGVIFSAPAVFVYQGVIALGAFWFALRLDPVSLSAAVREISAVGGVLIVGVGLNLLEIKKIRVANMLPALVAMALFMAFRFVLE
ncbi:DUF554 domain-containing protein [Gorillibacterium timonense]|uniref:DUF554 domain-containing protein n=1 Tax=Gorillibacterium timonense TaxID=1689269 RepID=UPI000D527D00|nr:DUF554 domain-containing protein [Gorillibacterium timonense]